MRVEKLTGIDLKYASKRVEALDELH